MNGTVSLRAGVVCLRASLVSFSPAEISEVTSLLFALLCFAFCSLSRLVLAFPCQVVAFDSSSNPLTFKEQ